MAPGKTILITAGEPSGDRLGGALMAALKKQHPNLRFIGVGGPQMEGQGLKSQFPMSDLAVMGLFEVIPAIPRILQRIKQLTQLAHTEKPDLVITIDSQDFSKRLAKALRSKAPSSHDPLTPTSHIHYVAPKVWAWRQGRVKKLPALYTHLLTILPFEEQFFSTAGLPATYVGHPAVTTLAPYKANQTPNTKHQTLALLPGSRSAELHRHWPLFLQTYRQLRSQTPSLTAVLALPSEKALQTCQTLAPWTDADAITPTFGEARFPLLASATAALTKSGTNNLELALLGIPAVVTYQLNPLTHALATHLVKIPYVSLPNIILHNTKQPVVYPELIQTAATPQTLTSALQPLLTDTTQRQTQLASLKAFQSLMATPQPPADLAAGIVGKYLK